MLTTEEQTQPAGVVTDALAEIEQLIAGGAQTQRAAGAGVAADVDSLFAAVLSEREVATILADKGASAGLFVDAAEVFIGRTLKKASLDHEEWRKLEAIFDDERGRARAEADRLARHCLPLTTRFGNYSGVGSAVAHFFAAADISAAVVGALVAAERARWETERLRPLVELLAARAAALAGKDDASLAAGVQLAVGLLEELFTDERVGVPGVRAGNEEQEQKERAPALKFHLLVVLDKLHPVVSFALLDLAIVFGFENWHMPCAHYAALAAIYTEERAERFCALKNCVVDTELARNPALSERLARRIFKRHLAVCPYRAGEMLAHRAEVVARIEQERLGAAACGAAGRAAAGRAGDVVPLTDTLINVAYAECRAHPTDDYAPAASLIYERLGDAAGGALVRLKKDAITRAVLARWQRARRAGAALDALLAYPRQEIRLLLLGTPGDWRWSAFQQFDLKQARPEVRELYRTVILPRFATDRAGEVRALAMGMLMQLAEDAAGKQLALAHAAPTDIAAYARKAQAITAEQFNTMLARAGQSAAAGDYYHGLDILQALAARCDLTFAQYRRLAAYGKDPLTATVVASIPTESAEVKEFLRAQRAAGKQTCAALAGLAVWDVYERAFYAKHAEESVRAAFAKHNGNLTHGEVADLLCDKDGNVRKALLDNARWPSYAAELRARVCG